MPSEFGGKDECVKAVCITKGIRCLILVGLASIIQSLRRKTMCEYCERFKLLSYRFCPNCAMRLILTAKEWKKRFSDEIKLTDYAHSRLKPYLKKETKGKP
jgi:hypothetical protein